MGTDHMTEEEKRHAWPGDYYEEEEEYDEDEMSQEAEKEDVDQAPPPSPSRWSPAQPSPPPSHPYPTTIGDMEQRYRDRMNHYNIPKEGT